MRIAGLAWPKGLMVGREFGGSISYLVVGLEARVWSGRPVGSQQGAGRWDGEPGREEKGLAKPASAPEEGAQA